MANIGSRSTGSGSGTYQPLDSDLTTIAALDASTAGVLSTDGAGWLRKTYAQLKTALALVKADVGLGNVDNTSDVNKPVSTAQAAADSANATAISTETTRATTAEALLAPKASPALTGTPTVPTAAAGTNTTQAASTAFATAAIAAASTRLTPTPTKTTTYTAAVGDLAMMNVAGGATALTLPAAPADKSLVGYVAIGATTAVPMTINAGGADTLGVTGVTSAQIPLVNETNVFQYDAPNTRWISVANVKSLAALDARYQPIVEAVNTVATSGATQTIPDVTSSTISRITLSANCTFTYPTAASGKSFTLVLVQDGTGSRLVTWPGTVKWAGGTAPTLSTGAGKIDYLTFTCTDGTNWAGFLAGKDVR